MHLVSLLDTKLCTKTKVTFLLYILLEIVQLFECYGLLNIREIDVKCINTISLGTLMYFH